MPDTLGEVLHGIGVVHHVSCTRKVVAGPLRNIEEGDCVTNAKEILRATASPFLLPFAVPRVSTAPSVASAAPLAFP